MVPEIWAGQNRGGKKKKKEKNEHQQSHIASPMGIANNVKFLVHSGSFTVKLDERKKQSKLTQAKW